MSFISRLFGLLLILLILAITPFAFWAFNVDRVAMNPQTYKSALQSQNFYNTLLPALVDATAAEKETPPEVRNAATSLLANMSAEDWALIADKLLPPDWLQTQINANIDQLFAWINGSRNLPDIRFNLSLLKKKLNATNAATVAAIIAPKLPQCTPAQETVLAGATTSNPDQPPPFCNPASPALQQKATSNLAAMFETLGANLPDSWQMAEHLHNNSQASEFDMNRVRAFIWLDSRLLVLLFLIPIALFAMIIIVTIRSTKQLFRWLGWGLILSGLLTLLPIPLVPALGTLGGPPQGFQEGFGTSGMLVGSLVGGLFGSIASGMTLAVLTQVIVAIAVGFLAVFVSVLLPAIPQAEVSWHDVARERSAQRQALMSQFATGSTPRPYGSTVANTDTPASRYTPPPPLAPTAPVAPLSARGPDPLDDLFPQNSPVNLNADTYIAEVPPQGD